MRRVVQYRWWMPPRFAGGKERLSTYFMTEEEGKERGALRLEPSTKQVLEIPDSDVNGSFSHLGRFPDKLK